MSAPDRLLAALAEAASALSADDPVRAAAAMRNVEGACDELRAAGRPLDAAMVSQARALVERCDSLAAGVQARLAGQFARAGSGRRAGLAYRPR